MRAILTCVQFDDLLAITLPRNVKHFEKVLVVTHPEDWRTRTVVVENGGECFCTDAFFRHRAKFNKGLALEEAWNKVGRNGWWCILDVDILLPNPMTFETTDPECLYTAPRRILHDPGCWYPSMDWSRLPIQNDRRFAGYLQAFNASAKVLQGLPYFYDPCFSHAGGCDAYFESRWPAERKRKLPFEVLHLGPVDTNWFGRATPRVDGEPTKEMAERQQDMENWKRWVGWLPGYNPESPTPNRVEVPGYQPSNWEFPKYRYSRRG